MSIVPFSLPSPFRRGNEPEPLLEALKAGNFYCSTGPTIHDVRIEADGETLTVQCSPAERVFLSGYGAKSQHVFGCGIHQAQFALKKLRNSPFFRVTVRDSRGGRAWTSPIWL